MVSLMLINRLAVWKVFNFSLRDCPFGRSLHPHACIRRSEERKQKRETKKERENLMCAKVNFPRSHHHRCPTFFVFFIRECGPVTIHAKFGPSKKKKKKRSSELSQSSIKTSEQHDINLNHMIASTSRRDPNFQTMQPGQSYSTPLTAINRFPILRGTPQMTRPSVKYHMKPSLGSFPYSMTQKLFFFFFLPKLIRQNFSQIDSAMCACDRFLIYFEIIQTSKMHEIFPSRHPRCLGEIVGETFDTA